MSSTRRRLGKGSGVVREKRYSTGTSSARERLPTPWRGLSRAGESSAKAGRNVASAATNAKRATDFLMAIPPRMAARGGRESFAEDLFQVGCSSPAKDS